MFHDFTSSIVFIVVCKTAKGVERGEASSPSTYTSDFKLHLLTRNPKLALEG